MSKFDLSGNHDISSDNIKSLLFSSIPMFKPSRLHELNLEGTKINDDDLSAILGRFEYLSVLNVAGTRVSAAAFKGKTLTSLRELKIDTVTDEILMACPDVEVLTLSHFDEQDSPPAESQVVLDQLTRLVVVDTSLYYDDELIVFLKKAPNLKQIFFLDEGSSVMVENDLVDYLFEKQIRIETKSSLSMALLDNEVDNKRTEKFMSLLTTNGLMEVFDELAGIEFVKRFKEDPALLDKFVGSYISSSVLENEEAIDLMLKRYPTQKDIQDFCEHARMSDRGKIGFLKGIFDHAFGAKLMLK